MPHLRNRSHLGSQTLESQGFTRRTRRVFLNKPRIPTITLNGRQISADDEYVESDSPDRTNNDPWFLAPKRYGVSGKMILAAIFTSLVVIAMFGLRQLNGERLRVGFEKVQSAYNGHAKFPKAGERSAEVFHIITD